MLEHNYIFALHRTLSFAGAFSLLLPLWFGIRQRQHLAQHHRMVLWCCFMWAILTAIGQALHAAKQPNHIVWNIVTILETILLGYAFYLVIKSPKIRRILRFSFLAFMAVAILDFFYLSGFQTTTIYTVALESLLLIGIVLIYFEQILQELRTINLERNPMFLVGIGVIIYFAGTVMIFLLQNSVVGAQQIMMMAMINSVLSIFLNSIIARAFWLVGRETNSPSRPTLTL